MVIFHGYVSLPEGKPSIFVDSTGCQGAGNQEIDGFKQRDGWIQCAKNDACDSEG
jgi:hypothetical protein